MLSNN
jgi:transposase